jgi:membrane protein implicated in regulation of membrane protease activity
MASDGAEVGCVGVVTLATRGTAGPGEVHIRIRGGTETYRAWSERPLARGTTVLVVGSRGARTVDVEEWVDMLSESPEIPGLADGPEEE